MPEKIKKNLLGRTVITKKMIGGGENTTFKNKSRSVIKKNGEESFKSKGVKKYLGTNFYGTPYSDKTVSKTKSKIKDGEVLSKESKRKMTSREAGKMPKTYMKGKTFSNSEPGSTVSKYKEGKSRGVSTQKPGETSKKVNLGALKQGRFYRGEVKKQKASQEANRNTAKSAVEYLKNKKK